MRPSQNDGPGPLHHYEALDSLFDGLPPTSDGLHPNSDGLDLSDDCSGYTKMHAILVAQMDVVSNHIRLVGSM